MFATAASRLAGLTGGLIGWRPEEFWSATPAELEAIFTALAPSQEAADQSLIARLKEQFPDG